MPSTAIQANGTAASVRPSAEKGKARAALPAESEAESEAGTGQLKLEPKPGPNPKPSPGSSSSSSSSSSKSWEIPRKVFHSSIAPIVLALHLRGTPVASITTFLSWFLLLVVSTDALRLHAAWFERAYEFVMGSLMRESERTTWNGVLWYLIGCISVLHLLPADIACVSIFVLSWCDTSASVAGRLWGKFTPKLPSPPFAARKSFAGSLAAAVAGGLIAWGFWGTSLAAQGERGDGLSWAPGRPAILGTPNAPGPLGSGWTGFVHGISGREWWLSPPYSLLSPEELPPKPGFASLQAPAPAWTIKSSAPAMPLPLLVLLTGITASVSEAIDIAGLDDNLTVPVLSGAGIYGFLFLWGVLAQSYATLRA